MALPKIQTSAPGRICLFGEHQDYLGLPVVAMAINLRFHIEYTPTDAKTFTIHRPDIKGSEPGLLDIYKDQPGDSEDYCWGIARVLLDQGFEFPRGGELTFRSDIPVRAGCSSSSAMSSAWMRLLIEIGEHPEKELYIQDPETVAYLVYRGEKELFGGAGGMMDQYSCYLGGLIHVYPKDLGQGKAADAKDSNAGGSGVSPAANREKGESDDEDEVPYGVERLDVVPSGFILIDSGVPKDTQGVLKGASDRVHDAVKTVSELHPDFDLRDIELGKFDEMAGADGSPLVDSEAARIIHDHIINRDICRVGLGMLRLGVDEEKMGELLNEEHRVLSETIGISTPAIDALQAASLKGGALGAKINGSGGGGTLFCYAPKTSANVIAALRMQEVKFFPVDMGEGARVDFKND